MFNFFRLLIGLVYQVTIEICDSQHTEAKAVLLHAGLASLISQKLFASKIEIVLKQKDDSYMDLRLFLSWLLVFLKSYFSYFSKAVCFPMADLQLPKSAKFTATGTAYYRVCLVSPNRPKNTGHLRRSLHSLFCLYFCNHEDRKGISDTYFHMFTWFICSYVTHELPFPMFTPFHEFPYTITVLS